MKFNSLRKAILICAILGVSQWAIASSTTTASTATASVAQASVQPSFMYVVYAHQGEIKHKKGNQSVLMLDRSDLDEVIEFSDRPERIVRYITGKDLLGAWDSGDNSFLVDPPNAVLSANGMRPVIVELQRIKANGNQMIFVLKSDKKLPISDLKDVTLTIDINFCPSTNPNNC